jgi:Uma2 family endonuclease
MSPTATPPDIETIADLLARLGDVRADRVLAHPAPGTATEADLLAAAAPPRKWRGELVDGTLVSKPLGEREARVLATLARLITGDTPDDESCETLGLVRSPDGFVRLSTGLVRLPGLSFYSWTTSPTGGYGKGLLGPRELPNLVVETLSHRYMPGELARRRWDYFSNHVHLLWEVDPQQRAVTVYRDPTTPRRLSGEDRLEDGYWLPGFSVAVAEIFADLDARRPE